MKSTPVSSLMSLVLISSMILWGAPFYKVFAAPPGFTSNATVVGGTVVAGEWNGTNTGLEFTAEIPNDPLVVGATLQHYLRKDATEQWQPISDAYIVTEADRGTTKIMSGSAAAFEAIPDFANGNTYTFIGIMTDSGGELGWGDVSAPITVNISAEPPPEEPPATPPSVPVLSGISDDTGTSSSDGVTSDTTIMISGQADPFSTVSIYLDGESIGMISSSDMTWNFDYTATTLDDGTYVFPATAEALGLSSDTSSPLEITIDTEAPVVTLTGSTTIELTEGEEYNELGATAIDNVSGDLTDAIEITPPPDTSVLGTTTVTYSVSDEAGNTAEMSRTIEVVTVSSSEEGTEEGNNGNEDQGEGNVEDGNQGEEDQFEEQTTVSEGDSSVEITEDNATTSMEIIIPDTVDNATLDVSDLLSGNEVTLGADVRVSADTDSVDVTIDIPAGVTIQADAAWDGIINLPQVQSNDSVNVVADQGMTASVVSVIEVGAGNIALTFDKAVRLVFAGQHGKNVGYERDGIFTPITATCSADSQVAMNALSAGGNCSIDVGPDLVVWTKHFTSFVSYTQTAVSSGGSSGSSQANSQGNATASVGGNSGGSNGNGSPTSLVLPNLFSTPSLPSQVSATATAAVVGNQSVLNQAPATPQADMVRRELIDKMEELLKVLALQVQALEKDVYAIALSKTFALR